MDKIHYCTWSRSPKSIELSMLSESAKRVGIDIDVMRCESLFGKLPSLKRYIETHALPETDIILCTDGYDVLYAQGEDVIRSRFRELSVPLVFAGEKGCHHHFLESKEFFERSKAKGKYIYLNSGLIIGYVQAFNSMFNEINTMDMGSPEDLKNSPGICGNYNDQTIYGRYACLNTDKVEIDTNAEIFWTLTYEKFDVKKHAEISSDGVLNLENNIRPCLVHVPHRYRSYPVLLYMARNLGVEFTKKNVDFNLYCQHVKGDIISADKRVVPLDAEVSTAVKKFMKYKMVTLIEPIKEPVRRMRGYLGRKRRKMKEKLYGNKK